MCNHVRVCTSQSCWGVHLTAETQAVVWLQGAMCDSSVCINRSIRIWFSSGSGCTQVCQQHPCKPCSASTLPCWRGQHHLLALLALDGHCHCVSTLETSTCNGLGDEQGGLQVQQPPGQWDTQLCNDKTGRCKRIKPQKQ